jgi:hypothetical protein
MSELLMGERGDLAKDLRLVRRAAREKWDIPVDAFAQIPQRVYEIAMTTDDERTAVNASKVLATMSKSNNDALRDEEKPIEETSQVTVNVGVNVDARSILTPERRDARIAAICSAVHDRLGDSGSRDASPAEPNPVLPTHANAETNGVPST